MTIVLADEKGIILMQLSQLEAGVATVATGLWV